MKTRKGRPEDLEALYAIEVASFSTPWSKKALALDLENPLSHYILLEDDQGKVLGYGGMMKLVDEGHILNIALAPEARGKGYSHRLMEAMLDLAQDLGIRAMTLEVRPSNEPALALYEGFGFKVEGRRKNYYIDNQEDALILWKEDL